SAVAAAKGESDISVGNVVGSNLFNICLVMGTVGIFNPMEIDAGLHCFQFPFMIAICVILAGIGYFKQGIGKTFGCIYIGLFLIYILISYLI
ncbi:MAG: sodium:calcium antiporter, partial [Desulfobacteraceae bacterium]|nr:sodium:calcium antiporter [Desulfobacteraceae bacterium]